MANPKVLVVDDEPDVVSLIERTLSTDGMDVVKAYDGIGALDVIMTEVCAQIKSNPQTKDIPVVCLSSAHTLDARAQSLKAGAVELITKPFLPGELLAQIRRHLPAENVENVS